MSENIRNLVKFKDVNKSTIFLYTLLKINSSLEPIGTYMVVENCSIYKDMNLICIFHNRQDGFIEMNVEMEDHLQFDYHIDDSEGYRYYVMDFSMVPNVYDAIKNGEYSTLPNGAKATLNIKGHLVAVIGVNPTLYYEEFSNEFNVSINTLREKVELLDPPNINNETLTVSEELLEKFE